MTNLIIEGSVLEAKVKEGDEIGALKLLAEAAGGRLIAETLRDGQAFVGLDSDTCSVFRDATGFKWRRWKTPSVASSFRDAARDYLSKMIDAGGNTRLVEVLTCQPPDYNNVRAEVRIPEPTRRNLLLLLSASPTL